MFPPELCINKIHAHRHNDERDPHWHSLVPYLPTIKVIAAAIQTRTSVSPDYIYVIFQ